MTKFKHHTCYQEIQLLLCFVFLLVSLEIFIIPNTVTAAAQDTSSNNTQSNHLKAGIELFHQEKYDEALNEFNVIVKENPQTPLAYYYAAQIRLIYKQFSRAGENIEAALSDSSDFVDAVGLRAYMHKQMGETEKALSDWLSFISAVSSAGNEKPTIESIMLPEDYNKKLEHIKSEQLKAEAQRKKEEKIATITESSDTSRVYSSSDTLSSNIPHSAQSSDKSSDTTGGEVGIGTAGKDLNQLKNEFLNGIITSFAFLVLSFIILVFGTIGVALWIRRRRKAPEDQTFAAEVDRLLRDREESDEAFELEEERTLREYHEKSQEIEELSEAELSPDISLPFEPSAAEPQKAALANDSNMEYYQAEQTNEGYKSIQNERQPITEEIKALVTRMYREGRTIEEICRAADLTQTEVELIVAVRARNMEDLIEEVSIENDTFNDKDQLFHAIRELNVEGDSPINIAKKLGISTSEVHCALAIMQTEENTKT